jgi:transcriptional regulator with XRE-family HTH domain
MITKIIGQNIRKYRRALGISQYSLADRVYMCQPSICAIEQGRQAIFIGTLVDIAKALHVRVENLLEGIS